MALLASSLAIRTRRRSHDQKYVGSTSGFCPRSFFGSFSVRDMIRIFIVFEIYWTKTLLCTRKTVLSPWKLKIKPNQIEQHAISAVQHDRLSYTLRLVDPGANNISGKRKLKCSGELTPCSRCRDRSISCSYSTQKPRGRPRKMSGGVLGLEDREPGEPHPPDVISNLPQVGSDTEPSLASWIR